MSIFWQAVLGSIVGNILMWGSLFLAYFVIQMISLKFWAWSSEDYLMFYLDMVMRTKDLGDEE